MYYAKRQMKSQVFPVYGTQVLRGGGVVVLTTKSVLTKHTRMQTLCCKFRYLEQNRRKV